MLSIFLKYSVPLTPVFPRVRGRFSGSVVNLSVGGSQGLRADFLCGCFVEGALGGGGGFFIIYQHFTKALSVSEAHATVS